MNDLIYIAVRSACCADDGPDEIVGVFATRAEAERRGDSVACVLVDLDRFAEKVAAETFAADVAERERLAALAERDRAVLAQWRANMRASGRVTIAPHPRWPAWLRGGIDRGSIVMATVR